MKKKLIFLILLSTLILNLTGCGVTKGKSDYQSTANFIQISDNLYYYSDTKIVYIIFNEKVGVADSSTGYGYMSEYYSKNGNLCRFDENSQNIVEIKNND